MIIAKTEVMQLARIEKGWSCAKLAKEAGVTGQCIGRIERGTSASPETAKKIADLLGIPINELFSITRK